MPFNTGGIFNRLYSWVSDRDSGVKILAQKMDEEMNGFAAGINSVLAGEQKFRGPIRGVSGTAANPAFTFDGDTDTGIYRSAADRLGFSVGGAVVLETGPAASATDLYAMTRAASDVRYYRAETAQDLKGLSLTIEETAPYITFKEGDQPATVGNWALGISAGRFTVNPRDAEGLTIAGSGGYTIDRNASGAVSHSFTTSAAGSVTLGEFDGGSVVATRPGYGSAQANAGNVGLRVGGADSASLTFYMAALNTAAIPVFRVAAPSGNVQNQNNSYGGISDARLKENIADSNPQLADIMKMRVRTYNLIGKPEKQIGFVAQEMAEVKPGLVEDAPNGMLALKYSPLVPILVKALQELAERVERLEAGNHDA